MSDVVRRWIAAGLLIAGIAVAALAITDTGPFEDPPTEEERVEAAVYETIEIRFVNVSGHQARVEARYKFADAGAEPRTVLLLSEDGEWRVSDPG
jgi:hypothetical protein